MKIFDYIYYRIYHTYKYKWNDSTPGAYATSLLTLLQTLYAVLLPTFIYELITNNKIIQSKIFYLIVFFFIFLLNLYRYQKVTDYRGLAVRWANEEKERRKSNGILTVSFIVITLIIFLALATILGEIHQGRMNPIFN